MANTQTIPLVLALDDASATLETVGGKGASLARMAAAGLPVPSGFHITTAAYRRFVTENGLQEQILAAVSAVTPDQPATLEEASRQIGRLFAQSAMPDDLEVPRVPLSHWRMLRTFVPEEIHLRQREAKAHMYILIEEGGWKP